MSSFPTDYLPGVDGVQLAATTFLPPDGKSADQTVLLLHGAGQTRHSWRHAGVVLAQNGLQAMTLDTRGHGDSDWPDNGDYSIDTLIGDLKSLVNHLIKCGQQKPILVGASLGGITGLLAEGESSDSIFGSMVLVDITPKVDRTGVARIIDFMTRFSDGFSSVDEAVVAVAAYQSHRQRGDVTNDDQKSQSAGGGLKKNLRLADDGRYYWHWDPRLMEHIGHIDESFYQRQCDAASNLELPVLLIRGQQSEIVSIESANELIDLVPHARYVDIADAAHMVAGDSNDVFVREVVSFING